MTGFKLKEKFKGESSFKTIIFECLLFALALVLTPVRFVFGIYPFGLCLVCASRRYTPFAFCGALLSVVFFMDMDIAYIVALIGIISLRVIASFFVKGEGERQLVLGTSRVKGALNNLFNEGVYLRVCISALSALGIGLYSVIKNGYMYYDIFTMVFFTIFSGILTYSFIGAFTGGARARQVMFSVASFSFCIVYAISGFELAGINISILLSYAIVIYTSKYLSGTRAVVVGTILGIAINPIYAPVFALGGLISGLMWSFSAYLATMSAFVISMGYGILTSGYEAIVFLAPELLAVCLIMYPLLRFELLPKPKFIRQDASDNKSIEAVVAENKNNEIKERMARASEAFEDISLMFKDISGRTKNPDRSYFSNMCLEICEGYCYLCPKNNICWHKDHDTTEKNITKMSTGIFTRGEIGKGDIDERFLHRCPNIEKIIDDINKKSKEIIKSGYKGDKLDVSAQDYELMSKMLSLIYGEETGYEMVESELGKKATRVASKVGLVFDKIEVVGNRRKRVIATGIDAGRSTCSAKELIEALENEIEIPLCDPEFEACGEYAIMQVKSKARCNIKSAYLSCNQREEENGDTVVTFKSNDEKEYMLICDGMGSGSEAQLTSNMCATFLEKILSVSCEKELALSILNGLVRAKNLECSSSVDLLEIDLVTKDADFLKSGAAPSFIKRGDEVFKLESKTAPIGIMKSLDAEKLSFTLESGDILVMVSDGVVSSKGDAGWLSKLLSELDSWMYELDSIPQLIINEAKERNTAKDDMSVLVLLVE